MILGLAMTLIATLSDPPGDAFGNGTLVPPRAPVYRDVSAFDLREVRVLGDESLTLEVELGSLPNPVDLPLGFSNPVVEVYLDTSEGGRVDLLEGSGLRVPERHAWDLAVRLTGDVATGYRVGAAGSPLIELPVTVQTEGTTLVVRTPFAPVDDPEVFAVVGLYDALGEGVWRAVAPTPSTWNFSSETQTRPVVDVLAASAARQADAIDGGELARLRPDRGAAFFPVLMGLGLVVALVGLLMRRRIGVAADVEARAREASEAEAMADSEGDDARETILETRVQADSVADSVPIDAETPPDPTSVPPDTPRYHRDRAAAEFERMRRLRVEDLRDDES